MLKRKTLETGAFEERIRRRNQMAATTTLEGQAAFHFSHYFEVVSFHAVGAENEIEIWHKKML
jgi:hypothetical protein